MMVVTRARKFARAPRIIPLTRELEQKGAQGPMGSRSTERPFDNN